MKKVLILCKDFPPKKSVGGIRPYEWFKNFPEFGIEPYVVTINWKNTEQYDCTQNIDFCPIKISNLKQKLQKSQSKFIIPFRKAFSLLEYILRWRINFFDENINIYRKANEILKNNKFDLILATGEPFVLFKYADKLSSIYNVPWVGDYRDGWSTDHGKKPKLILFFDSLIESYERKLLNRMLFSSVSVEYIGNKNNEKFNNSNYFVHENGVDLLLLKELNSAATKNDEFTITYTGSIYEEFKTDAFFDATETFLSETPEAKMVFVGIDIKPNRKTIKIHKWSSLNDQVEIIDPVTNSKAIEYQLKSHVLLKFDLTGQSTGILGSKMYEYAATKIPIITILSVMDFETTFFPNKKVQKLTYSRSQILDALREIYKTYKNGIQVQNELTDFDIEQMSRSYHIKNLCDKVLKELKNHPDN